MKIDWKAAADEAAQIVHGAQAHQTEVTDKLAGHWAGRIVGAAIGKTPHEMRLVAIADVGVKPYCVCGWVGERMDDGEATERFRDHVVTS